jgi:aminotransferase EvaB
MFMDGHRPIPFNDLKRLFMRYAPKIERSVSDALASGWWILGERGKKFAEEYANFIGVDYCIPVGNGTDALEIAMRIVSAPGQEIITVANAGGYSSTAANIVGVVPVYADIEPDTHLLSIPSAVSKLTSRTAAVTVTHLYGGAVDVPKLREDMDRAGYTGVPIIEDCAQAHGATVKERRVGSLGNLSTFSFYPTKNLGATGDAGAILTSSSDIARSARLLQQYGWESKYRIAIRGGRNSRMDEVQAAVLSALLPALDDLNAERMEIREKYRASLPSAFKLLIAPAGSVAHLVVGMTDRRDELREFAASKGVSTDVHYPVLDCDQQAWAAATLATDLPNSRLAVKRIVSLPCFPGLTPAELDRVCSTVDEFYLK